MTRRIPARRDAALRPRSAPSTTSSTSPSPTCSPGTPTARVCVEVRSPLDLERDLGLPGGNIFHRPLRWPWAERPDEVGTWGVETVHPKVTVCGAGARRGGGVSGIPGHNSAQAVLR